MQAARSVALPISLLVLCCLFWGFSFPAMQISANHFDTVLDQASIPHAGPTGQLASRSIFNAARCALATLAFYLLTFPRQRHFSRPDMLGGLWVGLTFCLGILCQLIGL